MSSPSQRILPPLACLAVAALVAACSDPPTSNGLAPRAKPSLGVALPGGCTSSATCVGTPGDGVVHVEQVQVCEYFPSDPGVSVAVALHIGESAVNAAHNTNTQTSPHDVAYTFTPNGCRILWQNGEIFGPDADTASVSETSPAGYTTSSQRTTIVRNAGALLGSTNPLDYTSTVDPTSAATSYTDLVGGPGVHGLLVVFTHTRSAVGCTFTQGYWKNHEDVWPVPYSPTAAWMTAVKQVTGLTWDGLFGTPPKGGNSYVQLAHQWMAATLNVAGGASASASVTSTLSAAGAWLLANTPTNGPLPSIKNAQADAWGSTLDNFNNGLAGTPHCN
jgi:hypothetical protein